MKLNPKQRQAVRHQKGPLLIVAGAGTGKTTVITERIKYLIQEKKIDPQHIFAATFTQKSAAEMIERLDKVMPLGYQEPWLGTFHSLCDRILKLEGLELGIDPGFTILTQTDQWMFIKSHLFDFDLDYYRPLGNPAKFITALIGFFSRLTDEDISAEEFAAYVKKVKKQAKSESDKADAKRLAELSNTFITYQELKNQASVYDFGDLITLTLKLFRTRPNILNKYQQQFTHILVDEFQDTNYAQYQLIKLLAPAANKPNLVVVGDDDQSIYKFRGASVANILEFKQDYPKTKEIVLTQNYRSTQPILNTAYQVIQNNNPDRLESKLKINKRLKSQNQLKTKPHHLQFNTYTDEIEWITYQIKTLVSNNQLNFQDIAVLARANSQLEPFIITLKQANIPYQLVSNRGLFDQEEIRTLLSFLNVLADPDDSLSLFQLLSSHLFTFTPKQLFDYLNTANKSKSSLWRQIQKDSGKQAADATKLIEAYQEHAQTLSVTKLLYLFIKETNFLKPYIETESLENQLKVQNINLLFDRLKQFEQTTTDASLPNFLQTLKLWQQAGENPGQAQIEDVDTVSLMTVHAAKGLEFEAVFIPSLVAGRFPSINRRDPIELPDELIKESLPEGNYHIQEERRLFYVATTRAKRQLYYSWAKDYGGKRERKISGFLDETNIEPTTPTEDTLQLSLLNLSDETSDKTIPVPQFNLTYTSYSQIDTFLACPLKYKYRYIIKLPAEPHHSLTFGQTMHNTLYDFHSHLMQEKPVSRKHLLEMYDQHFIQLGYDSPEHKQQRFEAGQTALKQYHRDYKHLFGKPKLLEQSFRVKINKDVVLVGKIDRIDTKEDQYHLIDYKTGSEKDQKKVDKDEQLTLYALAAKEALKLELKSLSLYFIESGINVTTTRTDDQLQTAKDKLQSQVEDIQSSDFPPKPGYPFPCNFCEYNTICPFAAKPRN